MTRSPLRLDGNRLRFAVRVELRSRPTDYVPTGPSTRVFVESLVDGGPWTAAPIERQGGLVLNGLGEWVETIEAVAEVPDDVRSVRLSWHRQEDTDSWTETIELPR